MKQKRMCFRNKEDFFQSTPTADVFVFVLGPCCNDIRKNPCTSGEGHKKQLQLYFSNITSVLSQFPGQQVSTAVLNAVVILQ